MERVWLKVETMSAAELGDAIREASIVGYFHREMGATARHLMASHLGIDLGRDWLLNEEYLNRKTIREILAIGNDLGIFADERASAYLSDVLGRKSVGQCKKKELIDLILKSGADLAGRVPDEIKNVEPVEPEPEASGEDEEGCEEEYEETEGGEDE